ncbi:nuclear transport factor 2 family protein [Nocardia fusca]|uniref:nuclear transport factor 2 family protein n=1 Tax=Nocardia fusca TaxID=941183 RepID=UPI0037C61E91
MNSDDSAEVVARRFLAAQASGDVETLRGLLAEDLTWWVPGYFGERIARAAGFRFPASGVLRSRDALLVEFLGSIQALFVAGSHQLSFEVPVAEGDKAVALIHADADLVAGGSYHNDYALLFEVRDGRIVSAREYLDTLYAIDTLVNGTAPETDVGDRAAIELLRSLLVALQDPDRVKTCPPLFHEDGAIIWPFTPLGAMPRVEGRVQIERLMEGLNRGFRSLSFVDVEIHATDDPTLAFGTGRSDAVLASGTPYRNNYVFHLRARAGRITEYREYGDPSPHVVGPMIAEIGAGG